MYIKHDYSYINSNEHKLMDNGYGKMTVHSIHFDRHYSEEQKAKNRAIAETMTREEWNRHCDEISKSFDKPLKDILSVFTSKYNIHQVSEETSTLSHYKSDWDLHFYSNRGWNGKDYMDYFKLSFNDNRTVEQNVKLLEEIIAIVESLEYENIGCRIQYDAAIEEKKVEESGKSICEMLIGKFIDYHGMTGKIKIVSDRNGNIDYGFFKKNAKNKYYHISYMEILAMNI